MSVIPVGLAGVAQVSNASQKEGLDISACCKDAVNRAIAHVYEKLKFVHPYGKFKFKSLCGIL